MKLIYNIIPLLLVFASIGQVIETKKIVKSYGIHPDATVELNNKYGRIKVKNWGYDSVKVIIDYSLTAKNEDKIQRLRDFLNFDFTNTKDFVTITTQTGYDVWSKEISLKVDDMLGVSDITVNYTVFLPKSCELDIQNHFGDIYLSNREADATIKLSHGNFKAENFTKSLDAEISFGKVDINHAKDIKLKVSHCRHVDIEEASYLRVNSSFSSISVKKADRIRLVSKKDKIDIGTIRKLYGSTSLSNVYIGTLDHTLSLNTKLVGSINVDNIRSTFEDIQLESKFTNIALNFEKTGFELDLTHKNSTLSYPKSRANLATREDPNQRKTLRTKGWFGSKTSQKKAVTIKSENSDITFTFN